MKVWTVRFRAVDMDNFEELRSGLKSVETRAATATYRPIVAGDVLRIICAGRVLRKEIKRVRRFPSIRALLAAIHYKRIMPSKNSVREVYAAYYRYPDYKEKIRKQGIVAFDLK